MLTQVVAAPPADVSGTAEDDPGTLALTASWETPVACQVLNSPGSAGSALAIAAGTNQQTGDLFLSCFQILVFVFICAAFKSK